MFHIWKLKGSEMKHSYHSHACTHSHTLLHLMWLKQMIRKMISWITSAFPFPNKWADSNFRSTWQKKGGRTIQAEEWSSFAWPSLHWVSSILKYLSTFLFCRLGAAQGEGHNQGPAILHCLTHHQVQLETGSVARISFALGFFFTTVLWLGIINLSFFMCKIGGLLKTFNFFITRCMTLHWVYIWLDVEGWAHLLEYTV